VRPAAEEFSSCSAFFVPCDHFPLDKIPRSHYTWRLNTRSASYAGANSKDLRGE
jgi:hypothetical protein